MKYVSIRLLFIIIAAFVCAGFYLIAPFSFFLLSTGMVIVGICAVELQDPMVYGFADERGLHFRRFFESHFLSWNEIEDIEWRASVPPAIIFFPKSAPGRPRQLKFLMSRSALARAPSSEDPTPEIVLWTREQIGAARGPSPHVDLVGEWQQRQAIGSFGNWIYQKIPSLIVSIMILPAPFYRGPNVVGTVVMVIFYLAILARERGYPYAYGFADEKGLFFRRTFRWHFAEWNEVEDIEWRSSGGYLISLFLKPKRWRPRKLWFSNRGSAPREIIFWMQEQINSARDGKKDARE